VHSLGTLHRFDRPATRFDVPAETAEESNIGGRVDEQLDVDPLADLRFGEHEDPFHDDRRFRLDPARLRRAHVQREVVDRKVDRIAGEDPVDLLDHEGRLERIGVVKVDLMALLER